MTFTIKGGPQLLQLLEQLPAKLQKNVLRGAMRAGAKVIQTEARLRVPVESGLTQRAIKISADSRGTIFTGRVSLRGRHSFLGPLIEYGVAPHFISVADAETPISITRRGVRKASVRMVNTMVKRGSLVINGQFVGPSVHHPGVAAHPFMRPAADAKAQEAVNAIGQYIRHRLTTGSLDVPLIEVEDE